MLAFLPESEVVPILKRLKFERVTQNTITDPKKFQQHLARIRQIGYAVDDEENEVGIRCIGSPIYDHAGRLSGALSISGWTITMTRERVPEVAPELLLTCQHISNALGFIGETQEES
jgi:IclR family acetate operon transcriptional repressor